MDSLSDMLSKLETAMPTPPKGGRKSKPVGKVMLFVLQVAEPFQQISLGGSQMNWVRFMAETHHNFGHFHIRMEGNPESAMTVMTDEEFRKKMGR